MRTRFCWVMVLGLLVGCSALKTKEEKEILSDEKIHYSGAKVPVSVIEFTNKSAQSDSGRCWGWGYWPELGGAFSERLIASMDRYEKFEVLERNTIVNIHEKEVDLINSEKSEPIEKGQFRKAKFTLAGVVTQFEFCSTSVEGGLSLISASPLSDVGAKMRVAKVEVQLRAIDTRTGKIIATSKGVGEQKRAGLSASTMEAFGHGKIDFSGKDPLGEAIDLAIGRALKSIEPKLRI